MNCVEAESLLDAHLDGELSGALRLEFDAHRLRCPGCQRKLAMLEACENILASDTAAAPALSDDFTDRLMARLATAQPPRRRVLRRFALPAAALPAAAAILLFAFVFPRGGPAPHVTIIESGSSGPPALVSGDTDERGFARFGEDIWRPFERVQAASVRFQNDLGWFEHMARSLQWREETQVAPTLNPVQHLLNILVGGELLLTPREDEASL